jgi:hypothetical protein
VTVVYDSSVGFVESETLDNGYSHGAYVTSTIDWFEKESDVVGVAL